MKVKVGPTLLLRFALLVVLVYAFLYAWAFVQLYRAPHSYEAASLWIYENIPAGSKLLGPHWDDRLPVALPGFNAHQYQYECPECELPFYEGDSPKTLRTLTDRMADGDYIIFPTPRIPGSIPRIPDEYEKTTALLQLLWSGKLGYKLLHIVKARPSYLGVELNDDLADESFSVYDHPKVTIFKNEGRLSSDELRSRVANAESYGPLPTLEQILLTNSADDALGYGPAKRSTIGAALAALLLILSIATLIRSSLPSKVLAHPDGGLGLALMVAPFTIGVPTALLATVLPIHLSDHAMRVLLLLIAAPFLARVTFQFMEGGEERKATKVYWAAVLVTLGAFLIAATGSFCCPSTADDIVSAIISATRYSSDDPTNRMGFGAAFRYVLFPIIHSFVWPLKVLDVEVGSSRQVMQMLFAAILAGGVSSITGSFFSFGRKYGESAVPTVCVVALIAIGVGGALGVGFDRLIPKVWPSTAAVVQSPHGEGEEEFAAWIRSKRGQIGIFVASPQISDTSIMTRSGVTSAAFRLMQSGGDPERLIDRVFEEVDAEKAYELASQLDADVIVLSKLEEQHYSSEKVEKFSSRPELFAKVFDGKYLSVFAPAFSQAFSGSFLPNR